MNPPPTDAFYFPTGVVHVDSPASADGLLYVVSSNFDKRFDFGAILPVNLSKVGLPLLDAGASSSGATQLVDLHVDPQDVAYIQSFGGTMAAWTGPDGGTRLFVPSRAEGSLLGVLEAPGVVGDRTPVGCYFPSSGGDNNCISSAPSLVAYQTSLPDGGTAGIPRAPAPMGVGISTDGDVFITHSTSADSPPGTLTNLHTYMVRLQAADPVVTPDSYVELPGGGGTDSVVVGSRYAYVTGRYVSPYGYMVRMVDRTDGAVVNPSLEAQYHVLEARGLALNSDETRLYVAGRTPDTLLVVNIAGATTESPELRVARAVPVPAGANQVAVLSRKALGRGDLVLVTCSAAGVVAVYDDEVGGLVAQVAGVGQQPFAMAVDARGTSARIYVTNFQDGRVAVLHMPDLQRPEAMQVVALLGHSQTCLVEPKACVEGTP